MASASDLATNSSNRDIEPRNTFVPLAEGSPQSPGTLTKASVLWQSGSNSESWIDPAARGKAIDQLFTLMGTRTDWDLVLGVLPRYSNAVTTGASWTTENITSFVKDLHTRGLQPRQMIFHPDGTKSDRLQWFSPQPSVPPSDAELMTAMAEWMATINSSIQAAQLPESYQFSQLLFEGGDFPKVAATYEDFRNILTAQFQKAKLSIQPGVGATGDWTQDASNLDAENLYSQFYNYYNLNKNNDPSQACSLLATAPWPKGAPLKTNPADAETVGKEMISCLGSHINKDFFSNPDVVRLTLNFSGDLEASTKIIKVNGKPVTINVNDGPVFGTGDGVTAPWDITSTQSLLTALDNAFIEEGTKVIGKEPSTTAEIALWSISDALDVLAPESGRDPRWDAIPAEEEVNPLDAALVKGPLLLIANTDGTVPLDPKILGSTLSGSIGLAPLADHSGLLISESNSRIHPGDRGYANLAKELAVKSGNWVPWPGSATLTTEANQPYGLVIETEDGDLLTSLEANANGNAWLARGLSKDQGVLGLELEGWNIDSGADFNDIQLDLPSLKLRAELATASGSDRRAETDDNNLSAFMVYHGPDGIKTLASQKPASVDLVALKALQIDPTTITTKTKTDPTATVKANRTSVDAKQQFYSALWPTGGSSPSFSALINAPLTKASDWSGFNPDRPGEILKQYNWTKNFNGGITVDSEFVGSLDALPDVWVETLKSLRELSNKAGQDFNFYLSPKYLWSARYPNTAAQNAKDVVTILGQAPQGITNSVLFPVYLGGGQNADSGTLNAAAAAAHQHQFDYRWIYDITENSATFNEGVQLSAAADQKAQTTPKPAFVNNFIDTMPVTPQMTANIDSLASEIKSHASDIDSHASEIKSHASDIDSHASDINLANAIASANDDGFEVDPGAGTINVDNSEIGTYPPAFSVVGGSQGNASVSISFEAVAKQESALDPEIQTQIGNIGSAAPSSEALDIRGVYFNSAAGDDLITGSAHGDFLRGGGGDDNINCGAGDDLVRIGAGDDRLTLGAGLDILYLTADQLQGSENILTDFDSNEDKLLIEAGLEPYISISDIKGGISIQLSGAQMMVGEGGITHLLHDELSSEDVGFG